MKKKPTHLDTLIIGDALCGSTCAFFASQREGRNVVVMTKKENNSATYNNTAIGQSGILQIFREPYAENSGGSLSTSLLRSGLMLLKELSGKYLFHGSGIVNIAEIKEEDFIRELNRHGFLDDEVYKLSAKQAQSLLGVFYEANGVYYMTPDCVFDIDKVTYRIQHEATNNGKTGFVMEMDKIELSQDDNGKIIVNTDIGYFTANNIILSSGIGNITLLKGINIEYKNLDVRKTPLIKLPSGELYGLKSKVYYKFDKNGDYPTQLVAVHGKKDSQLDDFLIITAPKQKEISTYGPDFYEKAKRVDFTESAIQAIYANYPVDLHHDISSDSAQWNYCYMVNGSDKYVPYVTKFPNTNLIVVNPGLASLAVPAAQEVMQYLSKDNPPLPPSENIKKYMLLKERKSWFRE